MTELLFSSTNIMITMDAAFAAADNESWGMDVISLRLARDFPERA